MIYGWMRYLAEPVDEFAIVNHPWQPHVHHLHIVVAPLLIFGAGMIWSRHVWARVRSGFQPRRPTGLTLTLMLLPMIASGYFLQVSAEEAWRLAWMIVHGATSVLWLVAYGMHLLSAKPKAAEAS